MSAVRALRQFSAVSSRVSCARVAGLSARSRLASVARPVAVSRAFSASARTSGQGTTDGALSNKLSEELKYETQAVEAAPAVPEFLKKFKEQNVWEIEDLPLHDEVTLSRKFGNEKFVNTFRSLRLMFSIVDIRAEEEEDFEGEEAVAEEDEDHEHEALNVYPLRASLSITKDGITGALTVDMSCQEGQFMVDNVSFYRDGKLATELTAEADWKRRGLYMGPQFETLDIGLQEELEKFLQERGVNESVALFIPEYAEWKEQAEYVKWLDSVKEFVDA
ncbi:mitochondrial glyco protein [Dendrothele bispora CBS 962.96]|uniref:Mitochondrial glyco protein n=1 Tax=Dendrothele bispora (strain CBS 962.96) TaxID=1314807 RepID=A0A4S8MNY9_DENBC|nr:mitochondrial glyco protein [Dendrothele bispora CBS 962.96]